MKNLFIIALLGILGVTGLSYSQEIPDGVKEYMKQLQNDPTVEYGFDFAKKWRFIDQNVQFKDWFVGLPFQFYDLNIEKLEKAVIDTKFEDLIEPTNRWCIPIKINSDSYIYHALVNIDGDGFRPGGCGEGVLGFKTWDKVRKTFPEKSGIIPIFFDNPYGLLYFPHIRNGKNIFHIKNPKWKDPMYSVTSKSLDNMDDGKTIIPLLKNKIKMYKEQSKELEQQKNDFNKNPDNCKDTSGGNK